MQTYRTPPPPPPILKRKPPAQLSLLTEPKPPTINRLPPQPERAKMSRKPPPVRDKLPLRQCVDYDKLTPSEQARWDQGMYGALSLKEDRGNEYYVVRWTDPRNGVRRSNAVGKDYETAIVRWRKMVLG
jgi:hypothetical protein